MANRLGRTIRGTVTALLFTALLQGSATPEDRSPKPPQAGVPDTPQEVPEDWVGAGGAPGEPTAAMQNAAAQQQRTLIPTPQEVYWLDRTVNLGTARNPLISIEPSGREGSLSTLVHEFRRRLQDRYGFRNLSSTPTGGKPVRIVFARDAMGLPVEQQRIRQTLATLSDPEGYVISCVFQPDQDWVLVTGRSPDALWRAMVTLVGLIERRGDALVLPGVEIVDYPHMARRGLLMDVGGQGFMVGPSRWRLEQWKEAVDWMVDHKLNELWLEFIGSGRLMGNLDMAKGEWIGFPLELQSFPQLVARNRPIRYWDAASNAVVERRYTAPNVEQDFVRELIDYAQARGVKCSLMIGYDYFANQLPFVLGVPANDPSHKGANKIYDQILQEIVSRYRNASGVILITIENKNVPPEMVDHVIRRVHEARSIIHAINPAMEVGVLNDYLEWRPPDEFQRYTDGVSGYAYQVYAPHTLPQSKSWKRIFGDVFRYELFSQYAWDHVAYIFPERVRREILDSVINGYDKVITQAWYWDVFSLNYALVAQYAWNATGISVDETWQTVLARHFPEEVREDVRIALQHTRFDLRYDIVARMLLRDDPKAPFSFWDMYNLTRQPNGLTYELLDRLEADAKTSLEAVQRALREVPDTASINNPHDMMSVVRISAERRLRLATSAKHYLRGLELLDRGDREQAAQELDACLQEGERMLAAARGLGLEFPLAVHDDEVVMKYRSVRESLVSKSK